MKLSHLRVKIGGKMKKSRLNCYKGYIICVHIGIFKALALNTL